MEKTLFAGSGGDSDSYDVVIIGAGISGISAAVHLEERCPDKRYLILEARDAIGGTWDLFRYPGVRSDSDMHTLGFRFKPWTEAKAIADGPSIRRYGQRDCRRVGRAPAHSVRAQSALGELEQRRCRMGAHGCNARRRHDGTRPFSARRAAATTATRRASIRRSPTWNSLRAMSCTRRPGRKTMTTPVSAWSLSAAGQRR